MMSCWRLLKNLKKINNSDLNTDVLVVSNMTINAKIVVKLFKYCFMNFKSSKKKKKNG